MEQAGAEQLIGDLYKHALGRDPSPDELAGWVCALIDEKQPVEDVVRGFYSCEEFRERYAVESAWPAGHYYSPIVDPPTVVDYVDRSRRDLRHAFTEIPVDIPQMRGIWETNLPFIQSTPFTDQKNPQDRYHYVGGPFTYGDAITLRMMIAHLRPQRIIEIGSGFSSACMLDSAEHAGLAAVHLTCVEPYPDRLKSLLRPPDFRRLEIIESPIQEVSATIVDALSANDILFIDSTHVLKTGSDVHYELFHLLPRLQPGVAVHFHDVEFPFEYPDDWIFRENRSWNEAYALRAFLMYNDVFQITFWPSLFAHYFALDIEKEFPIFLKNPGCSIWLSRSV